MLPAFCAFLLSLLGGAFANFFSPGLGAVVSVSVMGAFIVYALNNETK